MTLFAAVILAFTESEMELWLKTRRISWRNLLMAFSGVCILGTILPFCPMLLMILYPRKSKPSVIWVTLVFSSSPVKVILPLSFCYTTGLLSRFSEGGHHAGQSVRTFCREKSHFCDGTRHAGTRPGSGAT